MSLSGSVDQIRQFWSLGHLWTARNAAKRCGEIEATIATQTIVNREHQSLAVTAVFFAAAFRACPESRGIWATIHGQL